jgi:hypothetical protein
LHRDVRAILRQRAASQPRERDALRVELPPYRRRPRQPRPGRPRLVSRRRRTQPTLDGGMVPGAPRAFRKLMQRSTISNPSASSARADARCRSRCPRPFRRGPARVTLMSALDPLFLGAHRPIASAGGESRASATIGKPSSSGPKRLAITPRTSRSTSSSLPSASARVARSSASAR